MIQQSSTFFLQPALRKWQGFVFLLLLNSSVGYMAFWVGSLFFGPGSVLVHILVLECMCVLLD